MKFPALLLAASLLAISPLRAATIISTLDGAPSSSSSSVSINGGKAVAFTMPTGSGYLLGTVSLSLSFASVDPAIQSGVSLQLWSNDGINTPGSLLVNFANPTFSTGSTPTLYTFTPTSTFTLQPETIYWLALTNSGTTDSLTPRWYYESPNYFGSSIGATAGADGTLGVFGAGSPADWVSTSGIQNGFILDSPSVPEPATALLLLVAAGLADYSRRRR